MKKVKLICDSTCDLLSGKLYGDENYRNLVTERDVEYATLTVILNGVSYTESKDIGVPELFEKIRATGGKPSTAAVAPGIFVDIFSKYIDEGFDVVCITIGSKISGTFNSATIARDLLGEKAESLFLVDGANLSSGTGMVVLKACEFRDQGLSANEIQQKLIELVPKVKCQFGISTLEYLYRGGRASGLSFFVSKFLRIKPILVVRDGILKAGDKIIGKTEKTIQHQFEMFYKDYTNGLVDTENVFFTHCLAPNLLLYAKSLFDSKGITVKNLFETEAGAVISTHCGPGTLGIIYLLK